MLCLASYEMPSSNRKMKLSQSFHGGEDRRSPRSVRAEGAQDPFSVTFSPDGADRPTPRSQVIIPSMSIVHPFRLVFVRII